ncbi:MAG: FG-GAP repeat protein [Deltaproteobacteria bacterium]|nr:FG-GAP repeat protein [Deltaproteobacteria bacterium]
MHISFFKRYFAVVVMAFVPLLLNLACGRDSLELLGWQRSQNCGVGSLLLSSPSLMAACPTTSTKVTHDFNGDGIADVLVGANGDDDGGDNAGAVYIFYGSTSLASSIDASLANVKLIGEDASDAFGISVSGAGDVNKDGIDDILVGASLDDDGGSASGVAFIFYGSASLASSIDGSAANVKLIGEDASDRFGNSVSGAGDVNNDGFADAIVGAHLDDDGGADAGAAYIFYGATSLASSIDASLADVKLIGEDASDLFGFSVSGAGDINNNGIADVLVGAYQDDDHLDDDGGADAGAAYIFYGATSLASSIDASLANVKLIGEDASDKFGFSVSGAGDVNNNGIADVLVGAYQDDDGGSNAGAAYIFYGSTSLASSIDASLADVKLIGEDASDVFGNSVSGAGDVNKDGFADILVAARLDDDGGSNAGAAYIFYGSTSLASSIDASLANVKLIGEDADDTFGRSVSGAGDVNNDGFADVLVGAYQDDDGGSSSGVAFIFYGSTSLASSIDGSAANVKLIGEDAGDQLGISVSGGAQ